MQQVLVIHGGTTFDTQIEYINYLKTRKVELDRFRKGKPSWKDTFSHDLGESFDVLYPGMPNSTNARFDEWKIWFERILPLLSENLILIGHSLGGIFLAKYFSENITVKKIKAAILLAAPFDDANGDETLADFKLPSSLEKFSKQVGEIYLFHSKDDPVVPFEQLGKYKKQLPGAVEMVLDGKEHFNQERFEELTRLVEKL